MLSNPCQSLWFNACLALCLKSVWNVKALGGTFNQEKGLVGSRDLLHDCGNRWIVCSSNHYITADQGPDKISNDLYQKLWFWAANTPPYSPSISIYIPGLYLSAISAQSSAIIQTPGIISNQRLDSRHGGGLRDRGHDTREHTNRNSGKYLILETYF